MKPTSSTRPEVDGGIDSPSDPLLPYRLRTVRFGISTTFVSVAVFSVYLLFPAGRQVRHPASYSLLLFAAVGALFIRRVPWGRLLEGAAGTRLLKIWNMVNTVMISIAIAITGGGESPLFPLYSLTTLFLATSFGVSTQILLLLFTFAGYLTALAATGFDIALETLYLQFAILALLSYTASYVARELLGQMAGHEEARAESEQRAQVLRIVASAARNMSTLGPEKVLEAVVDAVLELGFEASDLCVLEEDGSGWRIEVARNLPESAIGRRQPLESGIAGLVWRQERTVIVEDYSNHPTALESLRSAGFRRVISSPIWSGGVLIAVLSGGNKTGRDVTPQETEAFELLAVQAGRALENAHKFALERESVERLEELDRMKRTFLTTVSHELRTPLTAIEGMGSTLEDRWESLSDGLRRELVGRLNANAGILHSIITTLLDFSRLESGLQVRPVAIDMTSFLESIVDRLHELLSKHELRVDVRSGLVGFADPLLLDRVVENLLANAAKHTSAGTLVELEAVERGDRVVVSVSDNGPGMSSEMTARLGERFFRGGNPNVRRVPGTGLGVALVMEILKLHDSHLEIMSEPGKGSKFSFELPLGHDSSTPTTTQGGLR